MDDQKRQVENLFDAARMLTDPVQRRAFLDAASPKESPLRSRLEALLASLKDADSFFEQRGVPLNVCGGSDGLECEEQKNGSTVRLDIPVDEQVGTRIGRYKLREKIGEGGCGIVYVAEQEQPIRRRVALKLIKPGMDTRQVIARLEAERQALAMMDHPNIAKVLDAGSTEKERPYFVMELVRGIRITEYCDQNQLDTRQRIGLFLLICNAVQHAHQKGIIHRDLKPSNILVTLHDGVAVPKVIDFGIAKALEGRLTDLTVYTELHQFIGTPAYSSPEQAEMSALDIDTRSDIYSLGVLLYELLTGRTPFDPKALLALGLDAVRRTIREVEPPRPSTRLSTLANADLTEVAKHRHTEPLKLITLIRGDLDWIVMKCLEKDRTRRYETADALAMDLRRLLHNEPVIARPPSKAYRLKKLAQRNKTAFLAAAGLTLALITGLGITSWALYREQAARADAESRRQEADNARAEERQQRLRAEVEELAARRFAYASDINLVQQSLAANNLGRAREVLDRNRPKVGQLDLRGWEWRYLLQRCQSDALFTLCRQEDSVVSLALAQDQKMVVLRTAWGGTETWDLGTRRRTAVLGGCGYSRALAFSPTANLIAFSTTNASGESIVEIRGTFSNPPIAQIQHIGDPISLDFAPDGKRLAIFSTDPGVQIWDSQTQKAVLLLGAPADGGAHKGVVLFSPNGEWLAIGTTDGIIRAFELGSRTEKLRFKASSDGITALAFSPNGKLLASGSGFSQREIKLWNLPSGLAAGELIGHESWITSLAFAPDGNSLASASGDQTIRLWDVSNCRQIGILRGHQSEVYTVAFARDGRTLVSGSKDGEVCVWDAAQKHDNKAYLVAPTTVRSVRFLPGRESFISLNRDGSVALWDSKSVRETAKISALGSDNLGIAVSQDGRLLAAGDSLGSLKVWDFTANRELTNLTVQGVATWPGRFLANGKLLQLFDKNFTVQLWETNSWRRISLWKMPAGVTAVGITPDERTMAAGYGNGLIRVFDTVDGHELAAIPGHSRWVTAVTFTPDGKLMATASEDGLAKLWDPATHVELAVLRGHLLGVHSIGVSPDGQRMVTGSNAKEALKLWDLATHRELLNLEGQGSQFNQIQFSPDCTLLLSINSEGLLHYWRAPSLTDIKTMEPLSATHRE